MVSKKTHQPPQRQRGRPPKLDNLKAHWQRAKALAKDINPHYSMNPVEQENALKHALSLPPKPTLVELGVTHGKTGVILAYAAALLSGRYVGVDNFKLEGTAKTVKNTFTDRRLPLTLLVGDTTQVTWNGPIDYLLIDGGHDRINVLADAARWLPLIKPGGLVLFHDFNPSIDQTDPHYFIKYAANHYTDYWEDVDFVPYLLTRRKPNI